MLEQKPVHSLEHLLVPPLQVEQMGAPLVALERRGDRLVFRGPVPLDLEPLVKDAEPRKLPIHDGAQPLGRSRSGF
jgi:hypothetical protein